MAVLGGRIGENLQDFREVLGVQVPLLALRNASRLGPLPPIVPLPRRRGTMLSPSSRPRALRADALVSGGTLLLDPARRGGVGAGHGVRALPGGRQRGQPRADGRAFVESTHVDPRTRSVVSARLPCPQRAVPY